MGKARNRAERTGDMDVVIGTTKLVPDASGDLEVKDASNNRKKVIASEIKLGSGNDVVIIKRDASTGKAQFQTSSDGGGSANAGGGGRFIFVVVFVVVVVMVGFFTLPSTPLIFNLFI